MLLKEIIGGIDAIVLNGEIYLGPKGEVKDGETVIGVLPDYLKKFYLFREELHKFTLVCGEQLKRLSHMATFSSEVLTEDLEFLANEKALLENKLALVEFLFWIEVRHEFSQPPELDVGVRQEWQVVSMKGNFPPELIKILNIVG